MTLENNDFLNGILCTDISDHLPVFCIKKIINEEKVKYVKERIFNDSNINKFKSLVDNIEWNGIIDITNCHQTFSLFQSHFTNCHEEAFPIVKMKFGYKTRKDWLSAGLKKSIKMKKQTLSAPG